MWTENARAGSYTLALADGSNAGTSPYVSLNSSGPVTVTVPTHASVAFPVGASIVIANKGTGLVNIAGASGVTLNSLNGKTALTGQYAVAHLLNTGTDTWLLEGNLSSTPSPAVFTCTGQDQTFIVPAGVTSINVKMWGAGGAGSGRYSYNGGGGGYGAAVFSVQPGESITIVAGCGGTNAVTGGGGGGRSALRVASAELLTAGGGGGAGLTGSAGAGGGASGQASPNNNFGDANTGAGGGTQATGGSAGMDGSYPPGTAGAQFMGGNGCGGGAIAALGGYGGGGSEVNGGNGDGGGGGGYYGGGGGGSEAGGGGGSGFGPSGATLTAGNMQTPANSGDVDRSNGAGNGGVGAQPGSSGLVKITWGS